MTAVPLTDIRAQLGDVKPATNDLIVSLAESVQDRRTHEHPTGNEDWFCNNLSGWAGDRTAVVLRRLLDAEAELDRLRAELETLRAGAVEREALLTEARNVLGDLRRILDAQPTA
jgi:hypothetical protein